VLGYLVPSQHRQAAEQTTHDEVDSGNDRSAMILTGKSAEARSSNRAPQAAHQRAGAENFRSNGEVGDVFFKHAKALALASSVCAGITLSRANRGSGDRGRQRVKYCCVKVSNDFFLHHAAGCVVIKPGGCINLKHAIVSHLRSNITAGEI
jgi:hypothetical protein